MGMNFLDGLGGIKMQRCNETAAYIIGDDIEYDSILFPREEEEGSYIKCFRYMDNYWIDALENNHLKLSLAHDFNDVFDCSGRPSVGQLDPQIIARHWQEDPTLRFFFALHGITKLSCFDYKMWTPLYAQYISKCIQDKTMVQQLLLLCLAAPTPEDHDADILMWSHYTNKWNGVRLGFRLLFENHKNVTYNITTPYHMKHVTYDRKRPLLDMSKMHAFTDSSFQKYYLELCHTKSPAWKYENEWRLAVLHRFAEIKQDPRSGMLCFWQFHKSLLETVDIGPKVPREMRNQTVEIIRRLYPNTLIRDAVPDDNEYKINYIEIG